MYTSVSTDTHYLSPPHAHASNLPCFLSISPNPDPKTKTAARDNELDIVLTGIETAKLRLLHDHNTFPGGEEMIETTKKSESPPSLGLLLVMRIEQHTPYVKGAPSQMKSGIYMGRAEYTPVSPGAEADQFCYQCPLLLNKQRGPSSSCTRRIKRFRPGLACDESAIHHACQWWRNIRSSPLHSTTVFTRRG